MKSRDIMQTPDGHYVDLSKIVAISPTMNVPQDFKVGKGFDIYFTPEGIPFKEDNCFKITVKKTYERPSVKDYKFSTENGLNEEGRELLRKFSEECHEKMEKERQVFVNFWKAWKDSQ